jgi:hypothetical protein
MSLESTVLVEYTADVLRKHIAELEAENAELKQQLAEALMALKEIREIYAGMEGFIPETCPEGYQQRIIKQMYIVAVEAIRDEADIEI